MTNALREVTCKIIDAQVEEFIEDHSETDDESPGYANSIILLLREIETKKLFRAPLSQEDIQKLIGLNRPLTSKEMINFATQLRSRTDPVRLLVDPKEQEVTAEMLLKNKPKNIKNKPNIDTNTEEIVLKPKEKFKYKRNNNNNE